MRILPHRHPFHVLCDAVPEGVESSTVRIGSELLTTPLRAPSYPVVSSPRPPYPPVERRLLPGYPLPSVPANGDARHGRGRRAFATSRLCRWPKSCARVGMVGGWNGGDLDSSNRKKRRASVCAVNQDAEKSFQKTVEVDRLIDMLRDSSAKEKDYEELATSVMSAVDRLVHKTNEKIESSTDVLKSILKPVIHEDEEISWPPREPDALILMERELEQREQEGRLDEGFLAEVNAQLRQAKEDGDKPGLEAMLQKVLQIYASKTLSKRSYAKKAPEESWNKLLIEGLTVGTGDIPPDDFYAVIKKRIERTLIRTEGGSYEQRILVEYLKGIESRTEELVQAIRGKQP
ncbi:hypothetical protein Taro_023214 [Colocasia esculenta]|uniref:Uncharacterized protein n=1 Tax=Colocasia esculenta TaxID=4460 RepID=A0A843UWS8_COLES|nr:hypothetical protein [Colocasia esculenta]